MASRDLPDRRTLKEMARTLLEDAGYADVQEAARVSPGVTVSFRGIGPDGAVRIFELGGVNTPARPGLSRVDNVWKVIAKAAICREVAPDVEFVVLTVGTVRGGPLAAVSGDGGPIAAVIDAGTDDAVDRILALTGAVCPLAAAVVCGGDIDRSRVHRRRSPGARIGRDAVLRQRRGDCVVHPRGSRRSGPGWD